MHYNAAYSGLTSLAKQASRRLLILVNSGQDATNGDPSIPCSDRANLNNLVIYSQSEHIPVNIIQIGAEGNPSIGIADKWRLCRCQ